MAQAAQSRRLSRKGRGHPPRRTDRASGVFAIDPEPWGAPFVVLDDPEVVGASQSRCGAWFTEEGFMQSAGPSDTALLHPDDVANLKPIRETSDGCCGPIGWSGLNGACGCGAPVATLAADCSGPYEVHFDPTATYSSSAAVPQRSTKTGPTLSDSTQRTTR